VGAWAKPRLDSHDPYHNAAVAYAAVVDGELLWGRNLDMQRAPASLTKLLTALVLLDSDWDPERWLAVSHDAAHTTHPRAGLHTGDRVRADDALQAMLMHSANDACLVLAENAAGSIDAFAVRMNAMARKLGMTSSHFVHPCGFDADGQYSTVTDLLRLAKAAHANPRIAGIVAQEDAVISVASGRRLSFRNTNLLLGHLGGVMGLKTGYTAQAGHCLIAVAEHSGHRVWVVLLDSQRRWWTAREIITNAFAVAEREPRLHDAAYGLSTPGVVDAGYPHDHGAVSRDTRINAPVEPAPIAPPVRADLLGDRSE
jgi:D-alanyl-D-alanine carboxypeptidase (penicillin-binding protein 5/6)